MPGSTQDAAQPGVQVLDRAFALMKAIADVDRPLTAVELARTVRINRSTAWRILATLERHGLVERDRETGLRYVLGYLVNDLASRSHHNSLIRIARPVLERLADCSGEFISLAVPQRLGIVYVDFLDPRTVEWPQSVSVERLHRAGPVHATSAGKVFLASLSRAEVDAVLPGRLEQYTEATIVDRSALDRELDAVWRQQFAVAFGEYEEYTSAISAPVLGSTGRLVAIVNVFGPTQRLTRSRLRELSRELRGASVDIADRLLQGNNVPAPSAGTQRVTRATT